MLIIDEILSQSMSPTCDDDVRILVGFGGRKVNGCGAWWPWLVGVYLVLVLVLVVAWMLGRVSSATVAFDLMKYRTSAEWEKMALPANSPPRRMHRWRTH